jgi:ABC-2 type transport system permease protein
MNIQNAVAYRGPMLVWLASNMVTMIVFISLWLSADSTSGIIAGLSKSQLVTYYLTGLWLQWIAGWYPMWIKDQIKNGSIASDTFTRPINFYWKIFFIELGWHLVSIWVGLTAMLILGYFFFPYLVLQITLVSGISIVAAIIVAIFVTYTISVNIGLAAFWLTQSESLEGLFWAGRSVFGGESIPIALFPASFLTVIKFLPFRYMYSFPLELMLGNLGQSEIIFGFGMGIVWVLILGIIYRILWKYGTRNYTCAGV